MRIISDFKDYYDCMQSSDQDRDTVFKRQRNEIQYKGDLLLPRLSRSEPDELNKQIIGFVDTLYVTRQFRVGIYGYKTEILSMKEYQENQNKSRKWANLFEKIDLWGSNIPWAEFGPIFTIYSFDRNQNDDRFVYNLVINPCLKLEHPEFVKVLSPEQAYQKLTRFVYNSSNQGRTVPEMDNDTKIHLAGFDNNSFRTNKPGGPKRKRK